MKLQESYYQKINEHLFGAVPLSAMRILEVGCAEGNLGAALKEQVPGRTVYGIEIVPEVAKRAAEKLDRVFTTNVEDEELPLEEGWFDCILYGDVLEHLRDPEAVLRKHRKLLAKGGIVLCSIPNIQHHSIVTALLRSDFQYTDEGLLDSTHIRFFTYSTFSKILLDAGFEPVIENITDRRASVPFLLAASPLILLARADGRRTAKYLGAYQYVFRGTPLAEVEAPKTTPLSFVVCVSDDARLDVNLLRSPCLQKGTPHELLLMRKCKSVAEAYNRGLEQAKNEVVVFVHQDVYLPRGWPERLLEQMKLAEDRFGKVGVFGIQGMKAVEKQAIHHGYVIDRDAVLGSGDVLPESVDTLDESLLVLRKPSDLRFDESLGFDFYGADICLAAKGLGQQAVAVNALCLHNSLAGDSSSRSDSSARALAKKWRTSLPIWTCRAKVTGGVLRPSRPLRSWLDKARTETEKYGAKLGSYFR